MEPKTAPELWATYLQLTRELGKFLDRKDRRMVTELLAQREKLQVLIDEQADIGYTRSPEGRDVVSQIRHLNLSIDRKMRQYLNASRQQRTIADAYDGKSLVGGLMDQKR